jgi:thioredoxin reductase (NADPH)
VAVIGGGNRAAEESLHLTRFVDHIDLLVGKGHFSASPILSEKVLSHPKITVLLQTEVKRFIGKGGKRNRLQTIDNQTAEEVRLAVSGVFVFIGLVPNTGFLDGAGIAVTPGGIIVTGHQVLHLDPTPEGFGQRGPLPMETSIPGIFSAGDVRDQSAKQIVGAAGEGSAAVLSIRDYLRMG